MPGFVQNNNISVDTALPGVEPVATRTTDTSSALVGTIGNAAAQAYTQYVKYDTQNTMTDVLKQFDQDLAQADTDEKRSAFIDKQLNDLAASNPEYKELTSKLRSLAMADFQGTAPKLMLQLNAEAALKRSLSRAPGLRAEITQAARNILGFDPSGALVRSLLEKDPKASSKISDMQRVANADAAFLQSKGATVSFKPDGTFDFATNREASRKFAAADSQLEALSDASKKESIAEKDTIASYTQAMTEQLDVYTRPIYDSLRNLLNSARTPEEWATLKPQAESLLANLGASQSGYIDSNLNRIRTTGEGYEFLEQTRKTLHENVGRGFKMAISSDDYSLVQKRVEMYDFFVKDMKMSALEADQSLAYMQEVLPGFIQQNYASILARDLPTQERIRTLVSAGLERDPNFSRRINMANSLATLADVSAYNDLGLKEKQAVSARHYQLLEESMKEPDKALASPDNVRVLGNAYATVAQLLDPTNTDQTRKTVKLLSDPGMIGLVDALVKTEDGNVTSEVVADSNIASLSTYVRDAGLSDVAYGEFAETITYNYDTGVFSVAKPEMKRPVATVGLSLSTGTSDRAVNTFKQRKETVDTINRSIEAIERMKSHDPSLSGLTKPQIAQYIVGGKLGKIKTVGEPINIPTPAADESVSRKKQFNDAFTNWRNEVVNTTQALQGNLKDSDFDRLQQKLDAIITEGTK